MLSLNTFFESRFINKRIEADSTLTKHHLLYGFLTFFKVIICNNGMMFENCSTQLINSKLASMLV